MVRVNISLPDDLHRSAKAGDLNVSELARRAITAELERRAKVAALDRYLEELDAERGPSNEAERAEAAAWAERVLGPVGPAERSA